MIFDKLCRFVEGLPDKQRSLAGRSLKHTALFQLDYKDVDENNRQVVTDQSEYMRRLFLPFPSTWVESVDRNYGCLMMDAGDLLEAGWGGVTKAMIDEALPPNSSAPLFLVALGYAPEHSKYVVFIGAVIPYMNQDGQCAIRKLTLRCGALDKRGDGELRSVGEFDEKPVQNLTQLIYGFGVAALELINSPTRWIVKREQIQAMPIRPGKIPRSAERPRYILVSHDEIERVIRDPNPANEGVFKDRRPHRRRAHSKLLSSEKFTWKRGQRVHVKACWVGPEQAEYGGERYTVCLDL